MNITLPNTSVSIKHGIVFDFTIPRLVLHDKFVLLLVISKYLLRLATRPVHKYKSNIYYKAFAKNKIYIAYQIKAYKSDIFYTTNYF